MMDTRVDESPEAKLHFLDYWRIIRIRKAVILTVWLLVVLTAVVVTYFFLKEKYASTLRIRVEKESTDVANPIGNTGGNPYSFYDPIWLQTEFEKIQSHTILDEVIRKLNLTAEWTKRLSPDRPLFDEETYEYLRSSMKVRQWRNTSLIEITVESEIKEEAAKIANTIAQVYRDNRLNQRREYKFGGIKSLEKHLEETEGNLAEIKRMLDDMKRTNNIAELGDNTVIGGISSTVHTEHLRRVQQERDDAEAEYLQHNSVLQKLTKLSRDELRNALPTALFPPDQLLNTLSEELNNAQQKLATLLTDYGNESPEVKRARALVDRTEAHVDERVSGIIQGLTAKVSAAKDRLDKFDAELEQTKAEETELAAKYRPYFDKKRDLEELLQIRRALILKIQQEKYEATLPISTAVEIFDTALPGVKPVKPNKKIIIPAAIVLGLLVGIGLAFFIEYLDTSVKTIDDVERALQAPVLGVIPQNVGTLLVEGPESPHAEAYRVLRTNILFTRKDDSLNTITVVSAGVGEGKSTTLLNLATVFAQNGDRVLVVDSDLRRPSLHKALKLSNAAGLTNYLLRQNSLEEVIQTTALATLDFLPSGKLPSSSMGILSSEQMKNLILELKRRYDFVFFDSPPIMGVSDASILASEVDMTLQVIQYRRYPQPMTIRAKQMIQKVGGNLLGIVLNNINVSQDESYYYYSGYYHDYYSAKQDDESEVKSEDGKSQAKLDLKPKY